MDDFDERLVRLEREVAATQAHIAVLEELLKELLTATKATVEHLNDYFVRLKRQ